MTDLDRLFSRWVIGAAIAQLLVQLLPLLGIGGPVGQISDSAGGPEVPAGYAFSIWAPLFVLGTAFAIWQRGRSDDWTRRVRPWAAMAMTMSALWMWMAQTLGADPITLPVIALMFVATLIGRKMSRRKRVEVIARPKPPRHVIWTQRWLGAQTGWLSLACLLNLASCVRAAGLVQSEQMGMIGLPVGLLAIGICIFMVMMPVLRSDIWFGGAVIWGLVAVIVSNAGADLDAMNLPVLLAAVWATVSAVVALLWTRIGEGLRVLLCMLWAIATLSCGTWLQFSMGVPLIEERPVMIWALLWISAFAMGYLLLVFTGEPLEDDSSPAT
ncbi:MAG: hypothetical protein Alpg2KO_03350 [Alphaproteobacteria bacterium]